MFGLRVPILSLVIGEGGSGGALAIGCANKNLILENSVSMGSFFEGDVADGPSPRLSPVPVFVPVITHAVPAPQVYYVASPEACAAILWKNRGASGAVRRGGGRGLSHSGSRVTS